MTERSVLLVSPNTETVPLAVYPLALARLGHALSEAGYGSFQYDVLTHGSERLRQLLSETEPLLIGISIRNIDNTDSETKRSYVGEYDRFVRRIRKHTSCPIVLGGGGFSLFPQRLLAETGAEFGVVGPGERIICLLADALRDGRETDHIPNLVQRGRPTHTETVSPVPMGPPMHDPLILRHYWRQSGMIGIQTKRGCPRKCAYCTYPLIDGRWPVWAEPGTVVDDMERLKTDHGIRYFFVTDSVFNLAEEKELAIAEEVCRRSLKISWGAFFAPTAMSREYAAALRRSGLRHVEFGTDSLSDSMLANYSKGFTVSDVLRTSAVCTEEGLFCAHYLIFGGPGETPETIRETIRTAKGIRRAVFFPFAGVRVFPGTQLHARVLEEHAFDAAEDLLYPTFYVAQGLDAHGIWHMLEKQTGGERHWVHPAAYAALGPFMRRLRQKGKTGPLWEYLADPFS